MLWEAVRFAVRRLCLMVMLGLLAATAGSVRVLSIAATPHGDRVTPACQAAPRDSVRCLAEFSTRAASPQQGVAAVRSGPNGYTPADLQKAYGLTAQSAVAGSGQTVAVVDAYDNPNAESDLGVYRSTFGLPACTSANGCFKKVDQKGGTNYPPPGNNGWTSEVSLDIDMVAAVCPKCHILLVEANDATLTNMAIAVDEAAALGATEISNSYARIEGSNEMSYAPHYHHPGIAITASAGNSGYSGGASFPAVSPYVTAVGGTTLQRSNNARGFTESAWVNTQSGCSARFGLPTWQASNSDITNVCSSKRAIADVSAVADPNTGVTIYLSYKRSPGWYKAGGTSVGAPLIAAIYALAGNASTLSDSSFPYAHTGSLNDVTTGSNGSCGTRLCNAAVGWDGPTGLGTPAGTGAF